MCGDLPNVRVDKLHLEQVFRNSLNLASESGGAPIITSWIVIGKLYGDGCISSDSGIGSNLKYFDQFCIALKCKRGSEYLASDGALASCRDVLEVFCRRIWEDSNPIAGPAISCAVPAGPTRISKEFPQGKIACAS